MSWGYKVDSGIFSPLMENIYFRTLIANFAMHNDKQVFRKVLRCYQYDFFIFCTPLAWFNSHHCICFFRGPDRKRVVNLLCDSGFPFECLQDRTYLCTFYTHTHTHSYYLPPFNFHSLSSDDSEAHFFHLSANVRLQRLVFCGGETDL